MGKSCVFSDCFRRAKSVVLDCFRRRKSVGFFLIILEGENLSFLDCFRRGKPIFLLKQSKKNTDF